MRLNEVAADIHRDMVDDDRNGYSWEERHGHVDVKVVHSCGKNFAYRLGDYDCSSSTITAWQIALVGTPYEGVLDAATWTGNMRSVFIGSGLFEFVAVSRAQRGDLYLNDDNHVAMCQGDGLLSEFCWGDNGAYGNRRGDQSGHEAYCHGYYNYPWWCCLHYNGKADYEEIGDDMAEAIFEFDDAHEGYNKHDIVYWNPTAGFNYLENMDCVSLLKQCNPGIAYIHTSKKAPWIIRAKQITNPSVVKATYGKHE